MAEKKLMTYHSNGKHHKVWIVNSTKDYGCFFVEADYGFAASVPSGKAMWFFSAKTYMDYGKRLSFGNHTVDGVAIKDISIVCDEGDNAPVLEMATKVAKAVIEQSAYIHRKAQASAK